MFKFTSALLLALISLSGCSKSNQPSQESPAVSRKNIEFSLYTNPDVSRDPSKTSVSVRLSILKARLSNIHTELVYDTIIPMRSLLDFPGPKAPIQFSVSVLLREDGKELLSISHQTIYKVSQKLESVTGTESMAFEEQKKNFDVKL